LPTNDASPADGNGRRWSVPDTTLPFAGVLAPVAGSVVVLGPATPDPVVVVDRPGPTELDGADESDPLVVVGVVTGAFVAAGDVVVVVRLPDLSSFLSRRAMNTATTARRSRPNSTSHNSPFRRLRSRPATGVAPLVVGSMTLLISSSRRPRDRGIPVNACDDPP